MYITKRKIKASKEVSKKRMVKADEAIEEEIVDVPEEVAEEEVAVEIEPEATDLLFEVEDVAELVAEATGEAVEVAVDDETGAATFTVGDTEICVEPDGDEEILESVRKPFVGKKEVKASQKARKVVRRVPAGKK